MKYQAKKLVSGREVHIRPLSWKEFWNFSLEGANIAENKEATSTELLQTHRLRREKELKACVERWPDLVDELTLPEVLEIESLIAEISKAPVREGNS